MITTPPTLGQHFAYAVGRLGVLELELLKQTDIDRLLGARSGEEAVKMLRDIEFLVAPEDAASFQDVLDASAKIVKENVEKMAPAEKWFLFSILWLPGDRADLSFALKQEHGFTSDMAVKPDAAVSAGYTPDLADSFASPQEIDDAVAVACQDHALALAKKSGSFAILRFTERLAEIEKLRRDMRTKGGDMETIVFEKEMAASLQEMLQDMQKMTLGPEALFSYAARALSHIALLKVLLTGKVNNLEIQEIKTLLPPLL